MIQNISFKELSQKKTGLKPEEIEVYTVSEYAEQIEDIARGSGVPKEYIGYLDIASIIFDALVSGDLSWEAFKIDGRSCLILWRET